MAKTILIKYNRPSLYRCGDFRVTSGVNEVRKEFWDDVKDNPGVKSRVESGEIELLSTAEPQGKPAEPQTEIADEPIDSGYPLGDVNVKEAVKIVKETLNYATLQDWETKEKRRAVLVAIKKQKAEFVPTEKDKDESDAT